ncbi:hypothetical protein JHK87_008691 [Glycine soja]|nr:hypothetical protein JHK87_008691 [Glycine soja]
MHKSRECIQTNPTIHCTSPSGPNLRLYDINASLLILQTPSQAPILDCCFQDNIVLSPSSLMD